MECTMEVGNNLNTYTTILLYYYTTILLYYYTTILLYYYTTILLSSIRLMHSVVMMILFHRGSLG